MGTVLRIPTYTYYDSNSVNKQSSVTLIMSDTFVEKLKGWNTTYGESGIVTQWSGTDITGIPALVNNFVGFPIMSKKSGETFLPIQHLEGQLNTIVPWISDVLTRCYVPYSLHTGISNTTPSSLVTLNNATLNFVPQGGGVVDARSVEGAVYQADFGVYTQRRVYMFWNSPNYIFDLEYNILPENFIIGNSFNNEYRQSGTEGSKQMYKLTIRITGQPDGSATSMDTNHFNISSVKLYAQRSTQYFGIYNVFSNMPSIAGSGAVEYDEDNPYGEEGTSNIGGGDGAFIDPDATDGADIPDLPTISAADLGFITMYNPDAAALKQLSDFMWSGAFDLVTYKKLFSDPMQSIIGLAIVPVQPSIAGSKNVMFGTIDSGITMNYLSTNYVQMDCGSVSIDKYVGCFMDNDPYTKISIYLPFIGIRQISADDCIGRSLHVVYNIDVLTGACACFIEVSGKGVLYSYNGSCITNVPLTAVNFSGAIQNAVSAIGSAIGIAAGMATGAAPVTAMSIAGLATSAANTALNSKPQVQRSGNLGGSAGIMSIMTPYVIIERPRMSVPNKIEEYVGQTSNITMYLGDCKGFTMCDYVHLDNLNATSEEIIEIESMLRSGVIF